MDGLLDAGVAVWPLALTLATVTVADRVRAARRRDALNRALHELRRPLQTLLLDRSQLNGAAGQLELALAALAQLDAEVNGRAGQGRRRAVELAPLVAAAVERWIATASIAGRWLELGTCPEGARVVCDPGRLAQALDNLIANALEHGTGRIRLDVLERDDSVLVIVSDGWRGQSGSAPAALPAKRERLPRCRTGRRGHGLAVVADVAADHGGRLDLRRGPTATSAALELPAPRG